LSTKILFAKLLESDVVSSYPIPMLETSYSPIHFCLKKTFNFIKMLFSRVSKEIVYVHVCIKYKNTMAPSQLYIALVTENS